MKNSQLFSITLFCSLALFIGCQSTIEKSEGILRSAEPTSAGVIIYAEVNDEKYLLLADHTWNDRGWGSFGGSRDGKCIPETAVTEGHEETAGWYSREVLEKAVGMATQFATDDSGEFASYVIELDVVPAALLTDRSRMHTKNDFRLRRPYAWIPLTAILEACETRCRRLPDRYLPSDRNESHLWPAFIEVVMDARKKNLL